MQDLPAPGIKGAYALIFDLQNPFSFEAGRFGEVFLDAGYAIYVGSALGPGGLHARLSRHLRPNKKQHWHIDYLTVCLRPVAWCAVAGERRLECYWVESLMALPGTAAPIPRFGSSDCRAGCHAHLIWMDRSLASDQNDLLTVIGHSIPDMTAGRT